MEGTGMAKMELCKALTSPFSETKNSEYGLFLPKTLYTEIVQKLWANLFFL
jgi:hypothetical protein